MDLNYYIFCLNNNSFYFFLFSRATYNSNLLSHPIFLEYIKTYDSVVNFRNVLVKNLPQQDSQRVGAGFLSKYYEKLFGVQLVELDKEAKITPQVIEMTSSVESLLSEVAVVFSQIIDELVAAKFDTLEKEQQLIVIEFAKNLFLELDIFNYLFFNRRQNARHHNRRRWRPRHNRHQHRRRRNKPTKS